MTSEGGAEGFRVDVVRSGDWWSITVPALPGVFSQARRLDQVEAMAREAISMMLDIDESAIGEITVVVTPPGSVVDLLEQLKASVEQANDATRAVAATRYEVAKRLREEGLPMRDVGELIGVSHQRVSQILAG